ncbi:replication-associated recombination protein A [Neofamilia massiliensis]|uniref:replication-associated recombination protein A n=1 Tax=Neofamilia massiliensis TaxID=1673724 RepID=UPI0006BB7063|nr:replication-associated recombination protein A [Neofamilia massiliensis]
MNDLFDLSYQMNRKNLEPLAEKFRPKTLDEFVGQGHIVGQGKLLNRLISADRITSMIFYGPPGTGKTTLASIIANTTSDNFVKLSAVSAGVKDIKSIISVAESDLKLYQKKTILFVDEIHRFNKAQQDVLLPFVEKGIIILIGATTENPIFEVNKALLSRSRIIEFKALEKEDLDKLIDRVLGDKDKGYGNKKIIFEPGARNYLLSHVEGDGRNLLNTLELAVITTPADEEGNIHIDIDVISNCIQNVNLRYDKDGDQHYNIISAFIKSIRGSDPDAAIYYLALMLSSGEDPKFIARRLIISAAEDIGLADPKALTIATACFDAVNFIGMPEGRIPLAEATVYLATAPKSNSAYEAINRAMAYVESNKSLEVPEHLKNIHVNKDKAQEKYKYPHAYEGAYVSQKYLEKDLKFYEAKDLGFEKDIVNRLRNLKKLK